MRRCRGVASPQSARELLTTDASCKFWRLHSSTSCILLSPSSSNEGADSLGPLLNSKNGAGWPSKAQHGMAPSSGVDLGAQSGGLDCATQERCSAHPRMCLQFPVLCSCKNSMGPHNASFTSVFRCSATAHSSSSQMPSRHWWNHSSSTVEMALPEKDKKAWRFTTILLLFEIFLIL